MKSFMMQLYSILIVAVFLGAITPGVQASEAEFTEHQVTLEHGIKGIVIEPKGATAAPAILLLHGFASQKDEVGDMYKRLAAGLGEQGIASLRIDFQGWGESAGEMADSTIQGQVDDAATAYNYLSTLKFVDPARVGVVGFSLGGGIAIISATQNPSWYTSMVLWSSVADFKADFVGALGQENFDRAAKEGIVTINLGWREVTLKNTFFQSLETYDLQQEISKYSGAFLAIAGSEDFSAMYVGGYINSVTGQPKEAFVIEGTGHIFGALDEDQSTANTVIEKTIQWFQDTL
jgi:pimeloyl-ACP methyl ester carboxylesterase